MKRYVLIAGVNGAGKSTLYQSLDSLKNIERVNADEIVRLLGSWNNPSDVVRGGKIAIKKIHDFMAEGVSFNQETTLCGKAILRNIDEARKLGYIVELHYVGVESVELAKQRIAYRVKHGGHGIPDEDVERRYEESFKQLKVALSKCDVAVLYDNTKAFNRFAIYRDGEFIMCSNEIPNWFEKYVK